MRYIKREVSVSFDSDSCFDCLFGNAEFFSRFHSARGDAQIAILDWMRDANGEQQRLCCYTMVDVDNGNDKTKCLETQRRRLVDGTKCVQTVVQPELSGGGGNLFTVQFDYVFETQSGARTRIVVDAKITVLKKIWGVTSMIESAIEKKIVKSIEAWMEQAELYLNENIERRDGEQQAPPMDVHVVSTSESDRNRQKFPSLHQRRGADSVLELLHTSPLEFQKYEISQQEFSVWQVGLDCSTINERAVKENVRQNKAFCGGASKVCLIFLVMFSVSFLLIFSHQK